MSSNFGPCFSGIKFTLIGWEDPKIVSRAVLPCYFLRPSDRSRQV